MKRFKLFLEFHKRTILTILLVIAFVWSMFSVRWGSGVFHPGGRAAIAQILKSLLKPQISINILKEALIASWRTLAYASAGMTLAIIIAIVFGILASGVLTSSGKSRLLSKTFFRGLLGFMRAIHELIWAWLFVAAVGLSPYAAILALAIPYGGTLGRIFADILNDVPKEPIKALKSSGASKLQVLFYGYLPMAKADMISYTMYRFECAVRSSTIMSFVGLGGLGFQINLALQDLNYNQVWTYMFFLTGLVVLIDAWSSRLRMDLTDSTSGVKKGLKIDYTKFSLAGALILMAASWVFIYKADKASLLSLVSEKNMQYIVKFLKGMSGIGEKNPAFMNPESWKNVLKLTYETLQMSVMAIGFAAIGMLLTVIPAARNVADGTLTLSGRWYNWVVYGVIRCLYIVSRSVPELVWAMIVIFIFKPGILPGAIALAIHNFGIVGKLCSEAIEDVDLRPIRNLTSSGANKGQLLIYGLVPTVMQKFLTFTLYRWEVILRTTIIVGFVGAGGLGMEFKLAMSYFKYSEITLILICYSLLVAIADLLSEGSRRVVQ